MNNGLVARAIALAALACGPAAPPEEGDRGHAAPQPTATAEPPALQVEAGPARAPLPLQASPVPPSARTGRALPAKARMRLGGNFTSAHALWFEDDELRVLVSDAGLEAAPEVLAFPTAAVTRTFEGLEPPFRIVTSPAGDVYVDGCRDLRRANGEGARARVAGRGGEHDGCAAFSAGGDRVWVAGSLWAIDRRGPSARKIADLESAAGRACDRGAAFDRGSGRIACPAPGGARIFDRDGKPVGEVRLEGPSPLRSTAAAFSGDGRLIVLAGTGFVARADAATLRVLDAFPTGEVTPFACAASKNGDRVATLSGTTASTGATEVILWDASSGRPYDAPDGIRSRQPQSVAVSPSGALVAVSAPGQDRVVVFDTASRSARTTLTVEGGGEALAFGTERRIYVARQDDIVLIDLERGAAVARAPRPGAVLQSDILRPVPKSGLLGADGRVYGADDLRLVFEARYLSKRRNADAERVPAPDALLLDDGATLLGYAEENGRVSLRKWKRSEPSAEPTEVGSGASRQVRRVLDVDPLGKLLLMGIETATANALGVVEADTGSFKRHLGPGTSGAFVHNERVAFVHQRKLFLQPLSGPAPPADTGEVAVVASQFAREPPRIAAAADRRTLVVSGDPRLGALVFAAPDP